MTRNRLSVTIRQEIIDRLDRDRGLINLSRYVDTLLGILYGLDPPEVLPNRPPLLDEVLTRREAGPDRSTLPGRRVSGEGPRE